MSNIVVPVLSVTIGLFFVFVGTIKLTPFISEEFYKEMVSWFVAALLKGCGITTVAACRAPIFRDYSRLFTGTSSGE
jgi:hypothetical protein